MNSQDAPWKNYPVHWPVARSWTRLAVRTRNPLLRPQTGREKLVARLSVLGLIVLAAGAVFLTVLTYQHGAHTQRVQATDRHAVTARVLQVEGPALVGSRYLIESRVTVSYSVAGSPRTATVEVRPRPVAGTSVRIWVTADGRVASAPKTSMTTALGTAVVAIVATGLLFLLVVGGRAGYDAWTVRRHASDWDLAWLTFDTERGRG